MAQFIIECPKCGKFAQAKTGFWIFGRTRTINCACGHIIDVRTERISSRECPHCQNSVVFDRAKGDSATCPVCKKKINASSDSGRTTGFSCPRCGCGLRADRSASSFKCPICEFDIDVQKEMQLEHIATTGIASVIKYEGDNNTFIWKHPVEDFNIGSQLIVHESQEAIFFRSGQALDTFTAGRHTLETESLPLVNNVYNSMLEPGGMFHSEVYFINLTTQMGIKWGTDSKVRFLEPITGIPLDLGASGEFNLRVFDSRRLLLKLVGTESVLNRDSLLSNQTQQGGYFRSMIMTCVKTFLAKTIKENAINILEIDEHLDALSSALRVLINEGLEEYGLVMPEFFVTTVVTPDDDANFKRLKQQHAEQYLRIKDEQLRKAEAEAAAERKFVEARTDANMQIIHAQGGAEVKKITAQAEADAYRMQAEAEALEMQMKGYTYAQETSRQVGLEAVKGGIAGGGGTGGGGGAGGLGDIVGLGVSLGAIGGVIGLTKDAISPIAGASSEMGQTFGNIVGGIVMWNCSCGQKGIKGQFCSACGLKKPEPPGVSDKWNCACGENSVSGKFCSNCGAKSPEKAVPWKCACGMADNNGAFCSNCGKKQEVIS